MNHRDAESKEKSGWDAELYPDQTFTKEIIGAAIEVHRALGPGLLESAYEACLCRELALRGVSFSSQVPLPVSYKGVRLDCGYRIDLLVDGRIVVEFKCVDSINSLHKAQLLTYLRLSNNKIGLIINFNVPVLKDGIERLAL
jgi:GxxExxY protein